eukprot:scaffold4343_cov144-Cylindrotheca_fusiformis.AAC.28
MGGERKECIESLFNHHSMKDHFEPPGFSPGVPSRTLRNRFEFFRVANEAGILPEQEWEAIKNGQETYSLQKSTESFFDCLEGIPVTEGRWGSASDKKLHYSVELWRKAKTINRGRAVLGCTFAHLIAMKKFVAHSYDILIEDNVRVPIECCADRIWETILASMELSSLGTPSHFRFYGYLGSIPNLKWIYNSHQEKRRLERKPVDQMISIFPLPTPKNLEEDIEYLGECESDDDIDDDGKQLGADDSTKRRKPGGNFIWGAYAYWISKEAYEGFAPSVLQRLRIDVGALLFRGNRARYYFVKPIDKILPRQIAAKYGPESVQLSTHPAFYRAPMLTSKIHTKWDPEFCKSTDYQLRQTGLGWSDLLLTSTELHVVRHHDETGQWLTPSQLASSVEKEGDRKGELL